MNLLFAIDQYRQEIIVSDSPKGSNKINIIDRIKQQENEMLFNAVCTLTSISKAADLDISIFNAMDKVCQTIYYKYIASR